MAIEDILLRFLAPLFGVLFGIPFAFWIDRKTRERSKRERAIAVLSVLKEEINHNIGLLKQIQNQLTPQSMIYYNMDMNAWRAISLEEFEGIISHKLIRHTFRIYYEYELMSRKIDTQFNMHYSVVRAMKTYLQERKAIVGAILKHASTLHKESEQLLKEIETELTRLSKNQPKDRNQNRHRGSFIDLAYGVLLGLLFGMLGNFFVEYWLAWHPPTQEIAQQGFFITLFIMVFWAIIFFIIGYLLYRRR